MSGRATRHGITQLVPVELIDESPFQVRMEYRRIPELAADIKKRGLIQPILLRPVGERYEVVHGHRRTRAVRLTGATHVLATIRELDDDDAVWIQLAENIQRDDYTPIELAHAYRQAVDRYTARGISDAEIIKTVAQNVNMGSRHVREHLNLLDLPSGVQEKVHRGEVSYTKARELTRLTRRQPPEGPTGPSGMIVERGEKGRIRSGGRERVERSEEHFDSIRVIAEEASRGGSIESPGTVRRAVELVGEGVEVEEAIEEAKKDAARAKAAARKTRPGEPPEVIAERLRKRGIPREELEEANRELSILSVRSMIEDGSLVCPHCGGTDLVWACTGKPLEEEEEDGGD
ncbi:ParB/RepB/Spo0J family partition protein [Candidatus Bathyarchaeota archaeon]|nr:ParB/RepB/Spo0J family partition protein [Candidatus Bathyarchaeota archaeon]